MTAAPQRTLWLAAGSLLALALTVSAGLSLLGWTSGPVDRSERHVLAGGITRLRVDAAFADVTLTPAAGDRVVVDSRAEASLWLPELHTRIDGGRVSLRGGCGIVASGTCSARFVVHVPRGVAVSVATATGDVRAEGLTAPLDVHAASGDVRATGLESDVVNVRASSGDVLVDLARAPKRVKLASNYGDVTILVPRDQATYDTQLAASSGSTDSRVPRDPGASRSLRAVTGSGDAAIRYR